MDAAESIVGTQARAAAWASIDRKLVAQAVAIPFDWDKQPNIESSNVAGVGDLWDVSPYNTDFPVEGISTAVFIKNMGDLIEALQA